ncbi:MAG TPA: SGNH/GDSL hydrolase family protein [Mycobacteriales bacterium]|nr:SGNH/GDSL hydrolase family protein [Mycobacteriales bacterium]
MRRHLVKIACLAGPASAILLFAPPAQAASTVDYAALGDSYSSGVGTSGATGSCLRSPQGYPQLWVNTHAVSSFQFAACSGATTDDVLANQLTALSAGTDLVSITIGGNDTGFADTLTTCQLGSDSACQSAVNDAAASATGTLPGKLDTTYAAIRSHAPNARVVVLGYPRLFELTSSCGFFGLDQFKRTILNQGADELETVIAGRAAAAGFAFVDTRPIFTGHGVCGGSPWLNGFDLFDITSSYHPNASGYADGYLPSLDSVTG